MQPQYFNGPPAPPMYQPHSVYPPPPPPNNPAGVIVIQEKNKATITNLAVMGDIKHCEVCQTDTDNIKRGKVSTVTFAWCFFLLFVSGGLLAFVPFCYDVCKDTQIICQRCQQLKTTVEATCC